MKMLTRFCILAILSFTSAAWAHTEVLDTGEVMGPGKFKLTGGLQALTERGGANATAIFDTGIQQDWAVRALAGFGKTDYYGGALLKWMPIPDVENQPAIGFNAGITYAHWLDFKETTFRFEPLISKKFVIDGNTAITPYGSIPIGIRLRSADDADVSSSTQTTLQFAAGGQLQVERWKNLQFIAELGLDLDHAESYIEVGAIFYFDSENGMKLE